MPAIPLNRYPDFFHYKPLSAEELDAFRRDGFLRLEHTLTDQGLETMRAEAMTAWDIEKGPANPARTRPSSSHSSLTETTTWRAHHAKNSILTNIHHHSETIRHYYFHGPLVDIATQIIGPNLKAVTAQLTFKMHGNTVPFLWHQDNTYGELEPYTALTMLTALDDTNVENGCLWLIPGSHKRGPATLPDPEEKLAPLSRKLEVDETRAVPVPMKAGDALCFHCWMLHKSGGNHSDAHRRILFMRFADADAVEVYNNKTPRLGRLLRGTTRFAEVEAYESDLL